MKHTILVFTLFLFALGVYAQDAFIPEAMFGVKAGANMSSFSFDPEIEQEALVGYTGGVVFKYLSQPKLGIQAELNYVQRGWKGIPSADSPYTRRLDYIELPFMTHVAIGQKSTQFIINLGPNISYLLSDRGQPDNLFVDEDGAESLVEERRYQNRYIDSPFIFGLSLGVGLVYKSPLGTLQLEGRLTQALSSIFERDVDMVASRNQSLGLTLSYLYNFRKGKK